MFKKTVKIVIYVYKKIVIATRLLFFIILSAQDLNIDFDGKCDNRVNKEFATLLVSKVNGVNQRRFRSSYSVNKLYEQ